MSLLSSLESGRVWNGRQPVPKVEKASVLKGLYAVRERKATGEKCWLATWFVWIWAYGRTGKITGFGVHMGWNSGSAISSVTLGQALNLSVQEFSFIKWGLSILKRCRVKKMIYDSKTLSLALRYLIQMPEKWLHRRSKNLTFFLVGGIGETCWYVENVLEWSWLTPSH